MGEILVQLSSKQELPLYQPITTNSPEIPPPVIAVNPEEAAVQSSVALHDDELNFQDSLLPLTESRTGSIYSAIFHLLSSGIGFQALLIPVSFATLGWGWGITCLSLSFIWQLYTIWLLVHLHESQPGVRHSRFLQLSMASFGDKLGKLVAIFPVLYLSAATCVMMIITGGGTMELFFNKIYYGEVGRAGCGAKPLSGAEWFLVFSGLAMALVQFPNLNSISWVSLIGAITAVGYCTLIWVLSIGKGRLAGISNDPTPVADFSGVFSAIGIILLSFRGHNVVLEIQGTLPTNPKHPSKTTMWKAVMISYLLIAVLCLFPIGIAGYWAYSDKIPAKGGLLRAFRQFHESNTSKSVMGLIYLLIVVNSLCVFQIYAMPVFDNMESGYTSRKKMPCPWWLRAGSRLFFGGMTYLVAVAFPFLGSLALVAGGIALPLTFAYPCFMWISIMKKKGSVINCLNWLFGCLGLLVSALIVAAAVWALARHGSDANFFNP